MKPSVCRSRTCAPWRTLLLCVSPQALWGDHDPYPTIYRTAMHGLDFFCSGTNIIECSLQWATTAFQAVNFFSFTGGNLSFLESWALPADRIVPFQMDALFLTMELLAGWWYKSQLYGSALWFPQSQGRFYNSASETAHFYCQGNKNASDLFVLLCKGHSVLQ